MNRMIYVAASHAKDGHAHRAARLWRRRQEREDEGEGEGEGEREREREGGERGRGGSGGSPVVAPAEGALVGAREGGGGLHAPARKTI